MNTPTPPYCTIALTLPVPFQVLADILTTAVEGGSHYWLAAHSIERDQEHNVLSIIKPLDKETDEPFDVDDFLPAFAGNRERNITVDTVATGIERLLAATVPARTDIMGAVLKGLIDPEDLDVDAEGADIIIQLGFFGTLVYG